MDFMRQRIDDFKRDERILVYRWFPWCKSFGGSRQRPE